MEASVTSGEKAGINGVVNVSVTDGWWDEGYDGSNGFAVTPVHDPAMRDAEEGRQLLDIIENQVVPMYYGKDNSGYAAEWVQISKNSMKTLIPRFNSARQVMDYVRQFYGPAAAQSGRVSADKARELSSWKAKVRAAWPGVKLAVSGALPPALSEGEKLPLRVDATLNGLAAADVAVECVLGRLDGNGQFHAVKAEPLAWQGEEKGVALYALDLEPLPGLQQFRLRMRPSHALQSHPFEMGCLVTA
jgi:starch phosphorylase